LEKNSKAPRAIGAVLGACIAVATIVMALPSAGSGGVLPATLDLSVQSGGAVAAQPAAPSVIMHAANLRPGNRPAVAAFDLVNQAGGPVSVSFKAMPSSTALDSLTRIAIRAEGKRVLNATLGELRQGVPGSIVLAPGEQRPLQVAARVPAEVETGYEGQRVSVELVPVERNGGHR
jgi:hypothetical protein